MSFGLNDKDWVDPDEQPPIKCRDCDSWRECPEGCGWGWCTENDDFTKGGDGCE